MGRSQPAGGAQAAAGAARARPRPMTEINVTPMVDVMLVLLIIFMVTAPLLTVGVTSIEGLAQGRAAEDRSRQQSKATRSR